MMSEISVLNEIKVNGEQDFMGFKLPIIEGGFGEDQRVMTAHTIAEIHGIETKAVNRLIRDNIDEFEIGLDLLDLLKVSNKHLAINDINSIFKLNLSPVSKNFYLLSEQGYMALTSFMRTSKAKEVRRKLRREYFLMRKQLKVTDKDSLILDIINSNNTIEQALAIKEYTHFVEEPLKQEIEVKDKELDIYERFLCNKLETITKTELATRLDTSAINVAKILKLLGIYTQKTNKISTKFLDMHPNIKIIVDHISEYTNPKTREKVQTKTWKYTAEGSKAIVDYLVSCNLVRFCENKGFKLNKLTTEEAFTIIQDCKL